MLALTRRVGLPASGTAAGVPGTAAFPMVEPAYEAVYHTYDEMEEYLTQWVDAHGEHALPSAPPNPE